MSAAKWRRVMSSGAPSYPIAGTAPDGPRAQAVASMTVIAPAVLPSEVAAAANKRAAGLRTQGIVYACVAAALLAYPAFATPFFIFQIGAQSLVLGLVALSLAFLAGYGGMVT